MSHKVLTPQQLKFCQNYITNGYNGLQAALSAGYTFNTASHAYVILAKPHVKEMISKAYQKAEEKILDKLGMSFEWRAEKLKNIIDAVVTNENSKSVRLSYAKVAIAAIAELNKMAGDYAPDKRLTLNVDLTKEKMKEVKRVYDEF